MSNNQAIEKENNSKLILENQHIRISTVYDSDGYKTYNEYIFDSEEEAIKFATNRLAIDHYGNSCAKSYYEYITRAEVTADINLSSLMNNE